MPIFIRLCNSLENINNKQFPIINISYQISNLEIILWSIEGHDIYSLLYNSLENICEHHV